MYTCQCPNLAISLGKGWMAKICPIKVVVKVLAIHSTVKICLLSGAQRFSHTEIKGYFIQNGQDVPITSQISKENFEMIKKLQKRRISLWYVLVLRLKGFTQILKDSFQLPSWAVLVNSELIEPKSKMLERILTRNGRKLKGVYNIQL